MFEPKALLALATAVSNLSKANTKVGCVIYDKKSKIITSGYNQFFEGLEETKEHWAGNFAAPFGATYDKHKFIIHAEVAALMSYLKKSDLFATSIDTVVVCTMKPCSDCMRLIAYCGIKKVFYSSDIANLLTVEDTYNSNFICDKAGISCQKI